MPRQAADARSDRGVVARVVEVDGIPMSGLVRRVREPRAVVVALHGGAASSAYFHHPGPHRLSLLQTGAALGFTVVAPDRPGYGRSAPFAESMHSPTRRIELAYAAVDALLGDATRGTGLFVLAHSAGCELGMRMAADRERGRDLLGLEIAGNGREFHATARATVGRPAGSRPNGLASLLWEPAELYPPEAIGGTHFATRAPAYEARMVETWSPRDFAGTASEIRVPVRYTLGDHDRVWRNDPGTMAGIAALFSSAPTVVVNQQAASGHNLSVGLTARAYHLKALSFVEECVVARANRLAPEVN